jgi:hypothetical protein
VGQPFGFMTARTLPGKLSTRCLTVSGGMAAHSSYRAVARAVSDVGRWEVGVLIHPTGVLWDSGQDSGMASPFLEPYFPQTIHLRTLLYGWEHCHADTDNCHHRNGLLP